MFSTYVLVNKKHNSCILSSDPFRFTPKQISICFILCFVFNPGFQLISSKFSIWTMSGSVSNIGISFSSLRPKTDFPQQISRFLLSQTRLYQADSPWNNINNNTIHRPNQTFYIYYIHYMLSWTLLYPKPSSIMDTCSILNPALTWTLL